MYVIAIALVFPLIFVALDVTYYYYKLRLVRAQTEIAATITAHRARRTLVRGHYTVNADNSIAFNPASDPAIARVFATKVVYGACMIPSANDPPQITVANDFALTVTVHGHCGGQGWTMKNFAADMTVTVQLPAFNPEGGV